MQEDTVQSFNQLDCFEHTNTHVIRHSVYLLQEYIDGMLRRSQHRSWCLTHGKTLPPPRLHPVILRVIREWFDLVDDDGSGTLEHHELLAALQVSRMNDSSCRKHRTYESIAWTAEVHVWAEAAAHLLHQVCLSTCCPT